MATYYVGPGGSNANAGTSYALRKLTLNGAEDIPVAAGDIVYVAPGVYREMLTVDVSAAVTYIGDVDGSHTDGVGGIVRITGSDNDTSDTRANCITATTKNSRTFRGFMLDMTTGSVIDINNCYGWVVEDCAVYGGGGSGIYIRNSSIENIVRRCYIGAAPGSLCSILFEDASVGANNDSLIDQCIIVPGLATGNGVAFTRVGGVGVRNCTIANGAYGVRIVTAIGGLTNYVYNNIFNYLGTAISATATGEFDEDYNAFYGNSTNRVNVTAGSNSVSRPPLFMPPTLLAGFRYPWNPYALSEWSQIAAITSTTEVAIDFYGVTKPVTSSKTSWGAVQATLPRRDTATKRTGSASLVLADADRHQMFIPTNGTEITVSCWVRWGSGYTGDKPQMVVKQPGQSDQTDTATGSADTWEELTLTLTPAANPPYVVVEFVSRNTAAKSATTAAWFDDLTVS